MLSGPNQRRYPRKKTKDTVQARADGALQDCIMVDSSEGGVGLLLRAGAELPDRFELTFQTGETRKLAMVWRSYPRCGAIFQD